MSDVDANLSITYERRLDDTHVQKLAPDVNVSPIVVTRRRMQAAHASLAFDLTITSIFVSLVSGKCLYIYDHSLDISKILVHLFSQNSAIISIIKFLML